jgi:hypothetical protein
LRGCTKPLRSSRLLATPRHARHFQCSSGCRSSRGGGEPSKSPTGGAAGTACHDPQRSLTSAWALIPSWQAFGNRPQRGKTVVADPSRSAILALTLGRPRHSLWGGTSSSRPRSLGDWLPVQRGQRARLDGRGRVRLGVGPLIPALVMCARCRRALERGQVCPTCDPTRRQAPAACGADHRRVRRTLLPLAYGTLCEHCGRPMLPGQELDLDHEFGPGQPATRLLHSSCNRARGAG